MECLVWCFGNRAVGWADVRKTDVHGVPKSAGSETMERAESRRERCPCRFGLETFRYHDIGDSKGAVAHTHTRPKVRYNRPRGGTT